MANASWYYELHVVTKDGDTGRIFEVLNVLHFFFWGSGAHNYGNKPLYLACGFLYKFPDKLKCAILNNYLVNPWGLPGRWNPHDLLQEHQKFVIKRVFPDQDTDFDSRVLQEVVTRNITSFGYLHEGLSCLFGLFHRGNKRTAIDSVADINILHVHYLNDNVHVFCHCHCQPFASVDTFSCGLQKLEGGQLETFLD
ncbi:hypothetical protein FS837_010458 [Tulasnella sp. UAMH 9824]|nr:hypothetical protein FS837_010458 [Tulasnella sp. UAMH 9824]